MLKKFPSEKINITKNKLFFLSRAPTNHNFTFNSQFLWGSSTCFISLKLCVEFSIFDSVLISLKFIFLFNRKHGFFDLLCKSMEWFLYDRGLCHEKLKQIVHITFHSNSHNNLDILRESFPFPPSMTSYISKTLMT